MARVRLLLYSPELNSAGRVFEEVRRELEGEVQVMLVGKRFRADAWLEQLAAEPLASPNPL